MLYRIKFDRVVSKVLNGAGYSTTEQKFQVWPAGLSRALIQQGKSSGFDAKSAAYVGMAAYFSEHSPLASDQKIRIVNSAVVESSKDKSIDVEIISQLQEVLQSLVGDSPA